MKDLDIIIKQIVDHLFPKLDTYEQMFYLYLFRKTFLENEKTILIPVSSISYKVGLGIGRLGAPVSIGTVRNKLDSLEKKRCISLIERTKKGIMYEIYLPTDIPGIINNDENNLNTIDIEDMDFYAISDNRKRILERDNYKCFYCLKSITKDNFEIDHVISKVHKGNNSYKNCVASCNYCNSLKQGKKANDFARNLYRENRLNQDEFEKLIKKLDSLQKGELKPNI